LAFASALEAAARGETVPGPARAAAAASSAAALSAAEPPPRGAAPKAPAAEPAAPPAASDVADAGEEAAEQEESGDDIDVERDEDEAHHALLEADHDRLESDHERSLFDEEEEADRLMMEAVALDTAPLREAEPFADEVELSHDRGAELRSAVVLPYQTERKTPEPPRLLGGVPRVGDPRVREGPRMFPLAISLVIGLLLGFAAGYGVASRDRSEAAPAAAGGPSAPPAQQAAGSREFSEQEVRPTPPAAAPPSAQPPAVAPDVPPDTAAAAAPTPRPAPRTGQLVVRSTPARAGVTVNGRWRGRTPLTLDDLPFATYAVRVVQPGFAVAREEVPLSSGSPSRTLQFRLRPQQPAAAAQPQASARTAAAPTRFTGSLYVDSRPRGARVLIDGKSVGTTPLRLPEVDAGSHVVRLELANHRPIALSTRVAAGEEARVTLSLEPER
jgi:hypothetical protein